MTAEVTSTRVVMPPCGKSSTVGAARRHCIEHANFARQCCLFVPSTAGPPVRSQPESRGHAHGRLVPCTSNLPNRPRAKGTSYDFSLCSRCRSSAARCVLDVRAESVSHNLCARINLAYERGDPDEWRTESTSTSASSDAGRRSLGSHGAGQPDVHARRRDGPSDACRSWNARSPMSLPFAWPLAEILRGASVETRAPTGVSLEHVVACPVSDVA